MEDKQAIEAIAGILEHYGLQVVLWSTSKEWGAEKAIELKLKYGKQILQTLISLGYVQMVEQKLPYEPYAVDLEIAESEVKASRERYEKALKDYGEADRGELEQFVLERAKATRAVQVCDAVLQDMLSVDSDECAWRRVQIKNIGGKENVI